MEKIVGNLLQSLFIATIIVVAFALAYFIGMPLKYGGLSNFQSQLLNLAVIVFVAHTIAQYTGLLRRVLTMWLDRNDICIPCQRKILDAN